METLGLHFYSGSNSENEDMDCFACEKDIGDCEGYTYDIDFKRIYCSSKCCVDSLYFGLSYSSY